LIYHKNNIEAAVSYLLQQIGDAKIVLFNAPMGSGKTTLINALCKQLGVTDATSSPTFSIINEYATNTGETLYHMDLYRITDEEELIETGIEDALYSGNYCFIEWPEIAKNLLPEKNSEVQIKMVSEEEREIIVVGYGK
jgi:tRNA threonylcarbamoyladenosine biosynthesis protein TsaE